MDAVLAAFAGVFSVANTPAVVGGAADVACL